MKAVSDALYDKMIAVEGITSLLGDYEETKSLVTFRPVPPTASMPIIIASSEMAPRNEDSLTSDRPVIRRDIMVCGNVVDHFAVVSQIADQVYTLFHRKPLVVVGWNVVSVVASTPFDAPADPGEVGKVVSLEIRLHRRRSNLSG